MGFLSLLTLLFIGAKLWGVIDWSWWIVLAPSIGEFILIICLFVAVAFRR